ncbi:Golgi integral membrane protein 4-like isoform X2 [Chrysoperla carnea]|uniref:Golgi integral membrane protein 4-like isoform X2 n=1 Tax=Chrysoperla carnea TaxID=189513 RepID=UPI001D063109|nr:Golgi integral membrane protein 4-like isoform X2 [Chrysoperla carnea]
MTAPRLSRGSRGRFFLYIASLLGLFGLMAIYHNTLTQLDAVKKSNDICQQHQDSLTAQLQVIFDYKNRLEKSLQSEKAEHKQTRIELQKRADNEKTNCEKNAMEANMRYSSLQQQFKILQSTHEDLKKQSSVIQKEKLNEINTLQSKVKEIQEQLKQKERTFENLKSELIAVQTEKQKLQELLDKTNGGQEHNESELNRLLKANIQLQRENDQLKANCNRNSPLDGAARQEIVQSEHVGDQPSAAALQETNKAEVDNNRNDDNMHVIPQPNIDTNSNSKKSSSTTTTTTPRTGGGNNQKVGIQPLGQPTPTIKKPTKETIVNNNPDNVLAAPNTVNDEKKIKIPPGVVPLNPHVLGEQNNVNSIDLGNKNGDIEPNRYRNNILESRNNFDDNNLQKPLKKPNINENEQIVNQENGAMEVLDPPVNKIDDPFNMLDNQNDGFVGDNQNLDDDKQNEKPAPKHIDSLVKNNLQHPMPGGGLRGMHYDAAEGGDYDKHDEKGGDLRLEEAEPEGEEDDGDDDYNGHLDPRQKDPAVRN